MILHINWLSYLTFLFPHVAFTLTLKTSNFLTVYKKWSELQCSDYRSISLLWGSEKILKRLMHNCLHKFLEKNSVIYGLENSV